MLQCVFVLGRGYDEQLQRNMVSGDGVSSNENIVNGQTGPDSNNDKRHNT